MAFYWQGDGEDDQIVIPALIFDELVFTFKGPFSDDVACAKVAGGDIFFNLSEPQLVIWQNDYATNWTAAVNGGARVNAQGVNIGHTEKVTVSLKRSSEVSASSLYISSGGNAYYSVGSWYDIKILRSGVIQAYYDLTLGHAQDQSGNGKHATVQGGTWLDDGEGGGTTPQPTIHTLSLSETISLSEEFTKRASRFRTFNDSVVTSDSIAKRLSVVVADTIQTGENGGISERIERRLSDFIPIDDNISISNSNTRTINLTDSIAILDSVSKSLTRNIADNVDLTDKEDETTAKTLLDNITLSDNITTFGGKTILLSETINITDSISMTKRLSKVFSETITLSDDTQRTAAQSVKLYDVIVTEENISVFNPDAPELVGIVHLKGKRELFVYLQGSRDLKVNLKGSRDLIINLKGGLNMEINQNFSMVAGDTKTLVISAEGDLTGSNIKWAMKQRGAAEYTLFKQGAVVNNEIHIQLTSEDTQALTGRFTHECEMTDQYGNVSTLLSGTATITPDMIKTPSSS